MSPTQEAAFSFSGNEDAIVRSFNCKPLMSEIWNKSGRDAMGISILELWRSEIFFSPSLQGEGVRGWVGCQRGEPAS